jgi:hypothetical protein
MQLSFLLNDTDLMIHPLWSDSISNSTYIGYDGSTGGLLVKSDEYGIVNWHTFCSLLKDTHTQALKKSETTSELKDFPLKVLQTTGPEV